MHLMISTITSSVTHFTRSATSLSFAYVSNLVPNSSLCRPAAPHCVHFSCCSRLHQSASTAAPRLRPLQQLLPDCIRFSCCSLLASASDAAPQLRPFQLLPNCVCFGCCSPIASASTAAPQLRPLQLQLPDCVHFNCCSRIASACSPIPAHAHALQSSRFSKLKYEGRASLVYYSPRPDPRPLPLHTDVDRHTHLIYWCSTKVAMETGATVYSTQCRVRSEHA